MGTEGDKTVAGELTAQCAEGASWSRALETYLVKQYDPLHSIKSYIFKREDVCH